MSGYASYDGGDAKIFGRFSMDIVRRAFLLAVVLNQVILLGAVREKILIYSDEGASLRGVRMLKLSLASSLGERYQIDEVRSDELKTKDWIRQTKLLIFPGGRDKPYHRKLSPSGNEAIRSFVEGGGSYLGICAGLLRWNPILRKRPGTTVTSLSCYLTRRVPCRCPTQQRVTS